jgi:putative Holliday junction resolvase
VTWDERLTTIAANRALREGGRKTRDSKNVVDQVAAQMILQGYLDGLQSARDRGPGQEIRPGE